jgi:hypothetical protein
MPKQNPIFIIGMGVTITTLLDSTRPKHFNTKILKFHSLSLILQDSKQVMPHKFFLILWWKASYVFTHLEDALQCSAMAG